MISSSVWSAATPCSKIVKAIWECSRHKHFRFHFQGLQFALYVTSFKSAEGAHAEGDSALVDGLGRAAEILAALQVDEVDEKHEAVRARWQVLVRAAAIEC